MFCDNRTIAEEYVYRYLAAARLWAAAEPEALLRLGAPALGVRPRARRRWARRSAAAWAPATWAPAMGSDPGDLDTAPDAPAPSTAEVRSWARQAGLDVPDRGRLRPDIWVAWHSAHTGDDPRK